MPLYKSLEPDKSTQLKIWKIEESFETLLKPLELQKSSLDRVTNMKSEIHQKGFLSIRHLLRQFGYTDSDLYYDENGKPHLYDGKYISISHSFQYSGVVISDHPVGIDIEKQRPKIKKIANKFIDYEFQYLDLKKPDCINLLTIIWCIKESLYKLFAKPGLSFKQHTLVIPFNQTDPETCAWIDFEKIKNRYTSRFFEFEGFTCAYVLP